MKKRKKDDDDSCLGQFVKTILLLACICWGVKTAMRTVVDNSWWLIGGIAVVSYLLVKLFKDDDYVYAYVYPCRCIGDNNLHHKLLFSDFYATTPSCYPRPLCFGRQNEHNAVCSSFHG